MKQKIIAFIVLAFLPVASAHATDDTPPWSQADAYWGKDVMDESRAVVLRSMGGGMHHFIMLDRLERQTSDTANTIIWDAQGWYGDDIDKLWIKSEGHYDLGHQIEEAEAQILWSHAISAYWDLQVGAKFDWQPEALSHAVIGVQGLAPHWFEIDAAAFASADGDITGRVEVEYDLTLNQRLILQPRMELSVAANDSRQAGVKQGMTHLNLGARLRYEFKREVAPYMGIEWQRALGGTAGLVHKSGGQVNDTLFVFGLRLWY